MDRDPGHRRLAGRFLAVAQRLTEERPDHDGGRVHGVHAEQVAVLNERLLDPLGRQHAGEGESRLSQERRRDAPEGAPARMIGIRYATAHEKPSLAEMRASQGGITNSQGPTQHARPIPVSRQGNFNRRAASTEGPRMALAQPADSAIRSWNLFLALRPLPTHFETQILVLCHS
jgi:hypothetical protein